MDFFLHFQLSRKSFPLVCLLTKHISLPNHLPREINFAYWNPTHTCCNAEMSSTPRFWIPWRNTGSFSITWWTLLRSELILETTSSSKFNTLPISGGIWALEKKEIKHNRKFQLEINVKLSIKHSKLFLFFLKLIIQCSYKPCLTKFL